MCVVRNESSDFLVMGVLLDFVDPLERATHERDEQIKHEDHIEKAGGVEEQPERGAEWQAAIITIDPELSQGLQEDVSKRIGQSAFSDDFDAGIAALKHEEAGSKGYEADDKDQHEIADDKEHVDNHAHKG